MGVGRADSTELALVYAPWGSIVRPSIALGILKQCAIRAGIGADVHYLNMPFAARIGLELYESISSASAFYPEWFFSSHLSALEEPPRLSNSSEDLQQTEEGRAMAGKLVELCGSEETRQSVAAAVPAFLTECLEGVDWSRYRVVGFSLMFAQTFASLALAKALKGRQSHLKIVLGGPSVDSEMGAEILKAYSWIDYVVHGEAEERFPALLQQILREEAPAPVDGVSFRRGDQVFLGYHSARPLADLNDSPAPDYTEFFQEASRFQIDRRMKVSVLFESSRGCWWGAKRQCTFCGLNGSMMEYRKKSADRVCDELFALSRRHRAVALTAVDNILDMSYFRELLPRLADLDHDLALFYEVKANLTREQLRLMAGAGITQIQPGIESLKTDLLQMMQKGVTAIQNIQLLKWCRDFGIEPLWNILYGLPGEEPAQYADYPEIMRRLFHLRPPTGVSPVIFERFSPYHFDRERYGLTLSPLHEYSLLYPAGDVDLQKIAYYFEGAWRDRASPPSSYVQPVIDAYKEWLAVWRTGKVVFQYETGPGFLTLHDSRPLSPGSDPVVRRRTLNELQSIIYLYCDEGRSAGAVMKKLREDRGTAPEESGVRGLLDQFVEQGLMFRDGDRYLSLAVRKRPERAYKLGLPKKAGVDGRTCRATTSGAERPCAAEYQRGFLSASQDELAGVRLADRISE